MEGPSALKVGNQVMLYFDAYTKGRHGALASTDLETWRDLTKDLVLPNGMRHATAFAVPGAVVCELLKQPVL